MEWERIRFLDPRPIRDGGYILYWMQASQRTLYNHALYHASYLAEGRDLPLVVCFVLDPSYPNANLRHFHFMLEGLLDVKRELEKKGVGFVLRVGEMVRNVLELAKGAAILVCDRGYLRHQRTWRTEVAAKAPCQVVQVETDAIVPVETAYPKEAYSAAVLRPKLHDALGRFLVVPEGRWPKRGSLDMDLGSEDTDDLLSLLKRVEMDRTVGPVRSFKGGQDAAVRTLQRFLERGANDYSEKRNDPSLGVQSDLSPYLHFGQVSPLYIALKALAEPSGGTDAFVEELFVRRELSLNFVNYCPVYDSFDCLPAWAKETLTKHSQDGREHVYSRDELENGETHDPYWNAAQHEMVTTGKMHGYMRMYWGKKVLEWSEDPRKAFGTLLYLNDRYELDGRDPNSYAGVAWCFGKHDRPWTERGVFGTVRYMNEKGLERKFDMEAYMKRVGYRG